MDRGPWTVDGRASLPRPDDRPARWVNALWHQWIDPVDLAFEEMAIEWELEEFRRRRDRDQTPHVRR